MENFAIKKLVKNTNYWNFTENFALKKTSNKH